MTLMKLSQLAKRVRCHVVRMSHRAGAAHLGSSLSCVDLLAVLYGSILKIDPSNPRAPDRDRFILSKGHASAALYATLAECGFFPTRRLTEYGVAGKQMAEQMAPRCLPGIEAATGSLGHGLPIAAGMALAAQIGKDPYRVFAVLSDGECNEGSVWEAAMFIAARQLANLTVLVDANGWQATGRTKDILQSTSLAGRWRAFGWDTQEIDGNDIAQISSTLQQPAPNRYLPRAVIAHTTKGKGVSFMEDDNNWHYRIPTAEEVETACSEIER